MDRTQPRILVVDDDPIMHAVCCKALDGEGYEIVTAGSGGECMDWLHREMFDLVLLDYKMPDLNGIEVLRMIRESDDPDLGVIIITGQGTLSSAIEAFRMGARDYVTKPVSRDHLRQVVRQSLEVGSIKRHLRRFRRRDQSNDSMPYIIGESEPMAALREIIGKVAASPISSVLIRGETGTGKSLVARAIHENSQRANRPFIQVNCTAIPTDLVEAELLGNEKGAFTDAQERKLGIVEQAHRGTLFLDEIGHVPIAVQPKLLNIIEERRFRRLGGQTDIEVDVRVIAATNRDLEKAIDDNAFRADLFYRLNVIPIVLPPLRDRGNDVLLLAEHFAEAYGKEFGKRLRGFTRPAREALSAHSWPGNVRELRNVIERSVLLCEKDAVDIDDLGLTPTTSGDAPETNLEDASLEEVEKSHILNILKRTSGNRTHAARILGVSTETLRRKLKEWQVE